MMSTRLTKSHRNQHNAGTVRQRYIILQRWNEKNCVDLGEIFSKCIRSQNSASIQPRRSLVNFSVCSASLGVLHQYTESHCERDIQTKCMRPETPPDGRCTNDELLPVLADGACCRLNYFGISSRNIRFSTLRFLVREHLRFRNVKL